MLEPWNRPGDSSILETRGNEDSSIGIMQSYEIIDESGDIWSLRIPCKSGGDFVTLVQEAMSIMETMPRKNQQIVLDLLRVMSNSLAFHKQPVRNTEIKMRAAVMDLAGLWKEHENELSIEETIRDMRKRRSFDT